MKIRRQAPPPEFLRWVRDPLAVKTTTTGEYHITKLGRDGSVVNELTTLKEKIEGGTLEHYQYFLTPNGDLQEAEQVISTLFCFEKMTDVPIVELSRVQGSVYRFKNAKIIELRFKRSMQSSAPNVMIQIEDCWIGRLRFADASSGTNLYLTRSWIGLLDLTTHKFQHFQMEAGGLLLPECPPSYGDNPFAGSAIFDKVYLPRIDGAYKGNLSGYQPWANMRAHLLALENQKDAGLFHATQLTIEEQYEGWGAAKIVSWIYRICSDYGNSIGRPAALLGVSVGMLCAVYLLTDAAVPLPGGSLQGWRSIFADLGYRGQFWRALYLSASPVLNPLGGVLGGSPAVESSSMLWAVAHGAHRLVSIVLIFLLFLGIRRRFRM